MCTPNGLLLRHAQMSFPDEELQGFCEGVGSFFVCVGAVMVGSGHAVYQLGLQRQRAFMATPFDLRVKDQILVYLHLKEDRDKHHLKSSVSKAVYYVPQL